MSCPECHSDCCYSVLTPDDFGWLYGLAQARVKKQQRRLDNYEAREGDDTYHFDTLAINLTRMEDTLARLKPLVPERWEWRSEEASRPPMVSVDKATHPHWPQDSP